jgi:hypothetical protein
LCSSGRSVIHHWPMSFALVSAITSRHHSFHDSGVSFTLNACVILLLGAEGNML